MGAEMMMAMKAKQAMSGGDEPEREHFDSGQYQGLTDMFDGGGAGQTGDQFEGGGMMSMLANMIASPYGSQNREQPGAVMSSQSAPAGATTPLTLLPYQGGPQATTFNEGLAVDRANADNRMSPPQGGGVLPTWSPDSGMMPEQWRRLMAGR